MKNERSKTMTDAERCVTCGAVIPEGFCGQIWSKSGLNVIHGILSTGMVDSGYGGSIKIKLYNHSHEIYTVNRGDKISQLVVTA